LPFHGTVTFYKLEWSVSALQLRKCRLELLAKGGEKIGGIRVQRWLNG
jgi:hypothetical protein